MSFALFIKSTATFNLPNAASYLFEFKPKPELTSMAKAYGSETAVYAAESAMEMGI